MLSNKTKYNIRILPILIFMAALSLSVKINNVFDRFLNQETPKISISQNRALAQEKIIRKRSSFRRFLPAATMPRPFRRRQRLEAALPSPKSPFCRNWPKEEKLWISVLRKLTAKPSS